MDFAVRATGIESRALLPLTWRGWVLPLPQQLAVMFTCGTYDFFENWASRIAIFSISAALTAGGECLILVTKLRDSSEGWVPAFMAGGIGNGR
jgi:hypothetical protein